MDLTESFTRNGLPGNYQLQVLLDGFVFKYTLVGPYLIGYNLSVNNNNKCLYLLFLYFQLDLQNPRSLI